MGASALAEHTWSTGHLVDLSKAEVVDAQPFVTTWCLLECWHIQCHPNMLNREKGLYLESTWHFWTLIVFIVYHYISTSLTVFMLHFIILLMLFIQHFTCCIIYPYKCMSASFCHHFLMKVAVCY